MKVVLSPHQGVVGSERSLKTALVSLFVEGVLEIEGDEKGSGCHGDYIIYCGCHGDYIIHCGYHGDYITHCGCWYLRSRLFVCLCCGFLGSQNVAVRHSQLHGHGMSPIQLVSYNGL